MAKCAIVTGGTRGIGLGICKALSADGYGIVASGTRHAVDVAEALKEIGANVLYVQSDVTKREDREELLNKTMESFGRVDVLINNAGVAPKTRMDLLETTEESFDLVMNTNLKGSFFLSQLVARQMVTQVNEDFLRIINISSISADTVSINRGEYCISKAAMTMMTMLFADRLASEGIRVFEIRPGIIKTDMTAAVTGKYEKMIEEGLTPIKRLGSPEDVARVAASLCRSEFDFCTGNIINVDGGFHIRRL